MRINVARFASFLVAVPVMLAACAPTRSIAPADSAGAPATSGPKNIVVINSGNPPGMDNRFVITTNNAAGIVLLLYAGTLIVNDNTGAFMPRLAEAVPSVDNGMWKLNPDNTMETRLTLRQGARWHDGTPLTTKDFLFNDEVFLDKSIPQTFVNQRNYNVVRAYIDRMEAADDRTLVIHWNRPYFLANIFSPEMMPAHVLEETFRQNPQNVTTHPWLTTEYVGAGPFKLKEFVPGSYMDLMAFDGYPLGRPRIDQVQVKFIPDGGTMLANILSGAGDLATGTGPNVTQAQELKTLSWEGQVSATVGATYLHLFAQYIDPVHPVITDKRFHKALMYALDRQELVDVMQSGYGGISHIPWSTADPDYNDIVAKIEKYPFDVSRAAAMFQSVGYAKGPDGYLRSTTTGQRLDPIEFRTTGEQVYQVRMLAAMSDYFKNVGLDINQVVVPQERTADRVYRVTNPGLEELQFGYGPSTLVNFMHSSLLPTPANGYAQGNYPRYTNAQWDALLERYAVTIAPAERKQVLTDIMVHLSDELPDMSIIYGVSVQFAARRLVVPEVNPMWTAESWDLK